MYEALQPKRGICSRLSGDSSTCKLGRRQTPAKSEKNEEKGGAPRPPSNLSPVLRGIQRVTGVVLRWG